MVHAVWHGLGRILQQARSFFDLVIKRSYVAGMFEVPDSLRQKYLQRRQQDVKDCFQKLNQSDWYYFTHLGHQLKGNAASYGYEDLARIAEKMETLAKEKDGTRLFDTLNEFRMWTLRHSQLQSPHPQSII